MENRILAQWEKNIIHRRNKGLNHQFVSLEIAKKLRDVLFHDVCFAYYDCCGTDVVIIHVAERGIYNTDWTDEQIKNGVEGYGAALIQQVIDWLEDLHKIRITTNITEHGTVKPVLYRWNFDNKVGKWERISSIQTFNTTYEAFNAGIIQVLDLPEIEYQVSKLKDTGEEYFEKIITGFKKEK